jgi:hypothetical protein
MVIRTVETVQKINNLKLKMKSNSQEIPYTVPKSKGQEDLYQRGGKIFYSEL